MSGEAPESAKDFWETFIDKAWLDRRREAILEPDLAIVDPHHHLWERPRAHYPLSELLADLAAGHNVVASVFMETFAYYRESGPQHLRPVGETEYVTQVAENNARVAGRPAVAAGIIGSVDLTLGARAREVLEAHIEAGHGRFKGVRANIFWDKDFTFGYPGPPPGIAEDRNFRAGIACLAPLGLVCDVFGYYTNLPDLASLARAFPETIFIIDHLGAPLGRGPYADRQAEMFAEWRRNIEAVAPFSNLRLKLGGLGGPFYSPFVLHDFRHRKDPPSSEQLAAAYRPYVEVAIDAFGPRRCMFESNYPADKYDCGYAVLWNAFKRLAASFSADEKRALFFQSAKDAYSLNF